jgi:hypothetical protein
VCVCMCVCMCVCLSVCLSWAIFIPSLRDRQGGEGGWRTGAPTAPRWRCPLKTSCTPTRKNDFSENAPHSAHFRRLQRPRRSPSRLPAPGISSVPFDSLGGIILLGTRRPLHGQTRQQLSAQTRSIVGGPPETPRRDPLSPAPRRTAPDAPPLPGPLPSPAPWGRAEAALTHREEWARLARCPHGRRAAPAFVCLLCLPRARAAAAARPLGSGPRTPSAAGAGAPAGSALGPAGQGLPLRGGQWSPRPGAPPLAPPRPLPRAPAPAPAPSPFLPAPLSPGTSSCRPRTSRRGPGSALGSRRPSVPHPSAPSLLAGQVRHGLGPPLAPPSRLTWLRAGTKVGYLARSGD